MLMPDTILITAVGLQNPRLFKKIWLQSLDLNERPLENEPDELLF
jgi:hypothetical protein